MTGVPRPHSSLSSVALVTGLALAQLLVQFATQLLLARLFGAGSDMDAFVAALAPPVVIATILSGSLGYVLVPAVAGRLAAGGQDEAHAVAGQLGIYVSLASLALAVATMAAAEVLVRALCPGFSAQQQGLTAELLRILAPLVVLNSLIAYLNALHQSERRFAAPAVAGVLGTLVTLGAIMLWQGRLGIFGVAWGVVAGAGFTVAVLLPRFVAQLREPLARGLAVQPATRQALAMLAPLVVGAVYWRLDPLVDRWLGSYLPAGSIAHLGYAWRLAMALMMIGTSGLSIVAFPAIAAHAAAQQWDHLRAELAQALRLLTVLLVPVGMGLALFAEPVVRLLFERGRFTASDSEAVAMLVVLYLGVVVGASLGDLLARTMYALHDTRTPVVINAATFTLAIALKFLLAWRVGVAGLAVGASLYYLLSAAALAILLRRRLGAGMLAGVATSLARSTACAAAACVAAWLVGRSWSPFAVIPAMVTGLVVYAVSACLLKDEFALGVLRHRWPGRGTGES